MGFGKRLHTKRKELNLTATVLAKKCGISRSYITLIENDKRLPGIKVLPKIADALNLRTNIVLNWYLEDLRNKIQKKIK